MCSNNDPGPQRIQLETQKKETCEAKDTFSRSNTLSTGGGVLKKRLPLKAIVDCPFSCFALLFPASLVQQKSF
jgi:hypothetical protein